MTTGSADEANAVVLNYLRKMGYRQTEQLFKEEAHVAGLDTIAYELRNDQDASISNYLLFSGESGQEVASSFATYEQAYNSLKQWANESLDVYRDELRQILYPISIHCFLDLVAKGLVHDAAKFFALIRKDHDFAHGDELARLEAVKEPGQIRENPVSSAFRGNKYCITMTGAVFQLLMSFLQEGATGAGGISGNILLLKIINQFVNIRVLISKSPAGVTGGLSKQVLNVVGITGLPPQTSLSLNRNPISWGVKPFDPKAEEILVASRPKDPAGRPLISDPTTNSIAQYKKLFAQTEANLPSPEAVPHIPSMNSNILNEEVERLKELSQRVILSTKTLPSICCYTVHNALEGVTSLDVSWDEKLLASGNRDSFIDVWSLTGSPLKAIKPSTELAAMDLSNVESLDLIREPEGSSTKRLIGHSGPVYATKFLDSHWMVSASQDKTLRLWSLDLFSTVVLFKGHTLPVWDVDAPQRPGASPYFVSGSADRTARLWSTEHIHPLRIFAGHLSDVDAVKFHPNENYVATGSSDKTIRLWDIQSGSCVRLLTGHERGVTALAISPDGRTLASGDRLGNVKVWDLAEGKLIKSLQSPQPSRSNQLMSLMGSVECPVYSLSFCQDARILASCGADGCVRLWDPTLTKTLQTAPEDPSLASGLLATFPTKQTPLFHCQFSRRNVLLTAGVFSPEA